MNDKPIFVVTIVSTRRNNLKMDIATTLYVYQANSVEEAEGLAYRSAITTQPIKDRWIHGSALSAQIPDEWIINRAKTLEKAQNAQ